MSLPSSEDEGELDKEENFSESRKEFLNGKEAYERVSLWIFNKIDVSVGGS